MSSTYLHHELLSQDSTGKVWKAKNAATGTWVVLKQRQGHEGLERLQREKRALQLFQGPIWPQWLGGDLTYPHPWAALTWQEGQTLTQTVEKQPLSEASALQLTSDALTALGHMHRENWLHRDIKPDNLLLTTTSHWHLLDLDSARPLSEAHEQPLHGSVHCMAPEHFRHQPLSPASDLYSLACSLVYAITGHFLHEADTTAGVITAHLHPENLHLSPRLSPLLQKWLMGLLAPCPSQRPKDACEAKTQLEELLTRG